MLLLQGSHDGKGIKGIPRNGTGISEGTKVPRKDIEAGKSPNDYLANQLTGSSDEGSSCRGESGMTPEEWIVLFVRHLEETEKLLDDWHTSTGRASLTGAFLLSNIPSLLNSVPSACMNPVAQQVSLSGCGPNFMDEIGARFAVRV